EQVEDVSMVDLAIGQVLFEITELIGGHITHRRNRHATAHHRLDQPRRREPGAQSRHLTHSDATETLALGEAEHRHGALDPDITDSLDSAEEVRNSPRSPRGRRSPCRDLLADLGMTHLPGSQSPLELSALLARGDCRPVGRHAVHLRHRLLRHGRTPFTIFLVLTSARWSSVRVNIESIRRVAVRESALRERNASGEERTSSVSTLID